MMLVELASVPTSRLPIALFRSHLRLGSGFDDDTVQDPILETSLRAALAAIEARTGKVTFERSFSWSVHGWRNPEAQALPVAPVTSIDTVSVISRAGDATDVDPDQTVLVQDAHRPVIKGVRGSLPPVPTHGSAEIRMTAGYAAEWDALPADLREAVFMLAGHYYELRHETAGNDVTMPGAVLSLIERYRHVRILGGAAS